MRSLLTVSFFLFSAFVSFCQPSATTVQADIKKDLGTNVISVTVLGPGKTSTEYVNGGYSTFYRVSLNVKLKTDMPGVTKLLQGAAKYNAGGGRYSFVQYAPGISQYIGLSAPDTAKIRELILSMPDYGLGMYTNSITEVVSFSFPGNTPALWHTLESVSIPATLITKQKTNNVTIETIKKPYELRLHRIGTGAWTKVSWNTPDSRSDNRRTESLGIETVGEYTMSKIPTLMEKIQKAEGAKQAANRPKVDIPQINTMTDLMKWYHGLLMEGDYAKVEAVTLQLLHRDHFDPKTNLLEGNSQIKLEYIKKALTNDFSVYSKQNCPNPQVMNKSATDISWWNKDKSKASTLEIVNENGRWFFKDIQIYVWDYHMEKRAEETMNTPCR